MSLLDLFYRLKEVESFMADLYDTIYQNIAHIHEEHADLFNLMADEEKVHERQVDMVLQYYKESAVEFTEKEGAHLRLEALIDYIKKTIKYIEEQGDELDVHQILVVARGLETDMKERHQLGFFQIEDPQIKLLFKNLMQNDKDHVERINQYIKEKTN